MVSINLRMVNLLRVGALRPAYLPVVKGVPQALNRPSDGGDCAKHSRYPPMIGVSAGPIPGIPVLTDVEHTSVSSVSGQRNRCWAGRVNNGASDLETGKVPGDTDDPGATKMSECPGPSMMERAHM